MGKPTQNRQPNAGAPHPADSNRTIINARGKGAQTTTTIVQQVGSSASSGSNVGVTAPLQMAGKTISLPQATGSVSGYLLAGDWTTFNAKMTNPMTTTGDLIVGGASGAPARLGIGANTYVLTSNGTAASWQPSGGGGGGSGLFAASLVDPPALASFTWLNQGTATATQNGAPIYMYIADTSPLNWRFLYKAPPATPYSIVTFMRATQFQANSQTTGLYFYDSGSGKILGIEYLSGAAGYILRVERITNPTTDNTSVYAGPSGQTGHAQGGQWLKIRNDGATLYFDVSTDAVNYHNLYSEAVGAWLTPDNVMWGGVSVVNTGGYYLDLSLISWSELNVATL